MSPRLAIITFFSCIPSTLLATPFLQLDIDGGTYVGGTHESVFTDDVSFTLRALLTPSSSDDLNFWLGEDYKLSIAVSPQQTEQNPAPNYGSFTINGVTKNVVGDMVYGTPPLVDAFKDMPGHSVYETYYYEATLRFDAPLFQVATYNVEQNAGQTLTADPNGGTYVAEIDLDFSGITSSDVNFHFDLYHLTDLTANKPKIDRFAPFSHDAETDFNNVVLPPDPGPNPVPEPGTLAIWSALLICGGASRRRKQQAS